MATQVKSIQVPNAFNGVLIYNPLTTPPIMTSQTDFDQGGTYRPFSNVFLGPSIGWVAQPSALFQITSFGTYIIQPGTTIVTVNVNGTVILKLPPATLPLVPAGVLPLRFGIVPITITDIGGFASANPITIQPAGPTETIMGLAQIQISVNYGGYTLEPVPSQKTWNSISP